jgi:activator of 2-hydroxyglutaryl-CoA dehydratase
VLYLPRAQGVLIFVNSKIKQAQKEGVAIGDISARLDYSIIRLLKKLCIKKL